MEELKSKNINLSEYFKTAKEYFEKVAEVKIIQQPTLSLSPTSQLRIDGLPVLGLQYNNTLMVSQEIALQIDNEDVTKIVFYHEFFHWALLQLGEKNGFKKISRNCASALLLLTLLGEEQKGDEHNFSSEEVIKRVFTERRIRLNPNFIEEATCDLFASILISKNEQEMLRNMFFFCPYRKLKELNFFIEKVATMFSQINECNTEDIIRIINEISNRFSNNLSAAAIYIGRITVLFAYEIYKENQKDINKLLRNLIYSPYKTVEKVIMEIKKDKEKRIIQNALSDVSSSFFENYLRE